MFEKNTKIELILKSNFDNQLEIAFNIYDTSGDGQIDQKELEDMISALSDLNDKTDHEGDHDPKKRATEIIAKLDITGDKKISKQEFIDGCKNDASMRAILVPVALLQLKRK
ncbi:unnamed protein product [Didymodactylos carnosus]|uniref:EF-hand domain-containing protein n=1 Tax=Didymodactylos carnosus TaxID=1234261 RepID=A0A814TM43_9BILA|nr:unnamed protein product [Didymodactylos carnosus]CAF1405145.1 unnamed protein product [Didymodactylos carnosus]CAF3923465.1 unnamed protein product [Didymodactylos carnosus]CAF4211023.1 unnamed protein product [Didymodactylos carnosus]